MKYKLINKTKISRKKIEKLIQFVCPKGINNFVVSLIKDNSGSFRGHTKTLENPPIIKIYIDTNMEYPRMSNDRNIKSAGYNPIFWIRNNEEALLSLLAHELRHIWQIRVSEQQFLNGKLCRYVHWDKKTYTAIYKMEKDACQYAKKMLHKYRNL